VENLQNKSELLKKKLQPGDIFCLRCDWVNQQEIKSYGDVFARLIEFAQSFRQKSDYCHTAAYNGDSLTEATFERGVASAYHPVDSRWDIYRPNFTSDTQRDAFLANLRELAGQQYDLLGCGLLGIELVFNFDLSLDNPGYFCSELIAHALEDAGFDAFSEIPSSVEPADFPGKNMSLVYAAGEWLI
jgi:hypothetical protein